MSFLAFSIAAEGRKFPAFMYGTNTLKNFVIDEVNGFPLRMPIVDESQKSPWGRLFVMGRVNSLRTKLSLLDCLTW